jgi:hypothetical protein
MVQVFLSATYGDLVEHRDAVIRTLTRMRHRPITMEDFGARPDTPMSVCDAEIRSCTHFVGLYAWRYGSLVPGEPRSITEAEFDCARAAGLEMLLYVADPAHPWPPSAIERGPGAEALERFKKEKIGKLTTRTFTTPDQLAGQVAADLSYLLSREVRSNAAGTILAKVWDKLSPELREVVLRAIARSEAGGGEGVVATKDVIAALVATPNSAGMLMNALPQNAFPEDMSIPSEPANPELAFGHPGPFSHCVSRTLQNLTDGRVSGQPILAVELATDLLVNGRGSSVAKFRKAGVSADVVNNLIGRANTLVRDPNKLRERLATFTGDELAAIGYSLGLSVAEESFRRAPIDALIGQARDNRTSATLLGEMLRRRPALLELQT